MAGSLVKFKAIIPDVLLTPQMVSQTFGIRMINVTKFSVKEHQKTVNTWKKTPYFYRTTTTTANILTSMVWTDDDIYRFVSEGVDGHPIPKEKVIGEKSGFGSFSEPVKPKKLKFTGGYIPKTSRGSLESGYGGSNGEIIFVNNVIFWPGIEARHFEDLLSEIVQAEMDDQMLKAIETIAEKSGIKL